MRGVREGGTLSHRLRGGPLRREAAHEHSNCLGSALLPVSLWRRKESAVRLELAQVGLHMHSEELVLDAVVGVPLDEARERFWRPFGHLRLALVHRVLFYVWFLVQTCCGGVSTRRRRKAQKAKGNMCAVPRLEEMPLSLPLPSTWGAPASFW